MQNAFFFVPRFISFCLDYFCCEGTDREGRGFLACGLFFRCWGCFGTNDNIPYAFYLYISLYVQVSFDYTNPLHLNPITEVPHKQ